MKDLPTGRQTRWVTINRIAREAGVSLTTVSRALNDRPDINPDTHERILSIAQELGYTPSLPARSLVTRDTATTYPHSVSTDILSGARQAMDHLIGLGHRRVADTGNLYSHNTNLNRLAGYTKTLTQHSIPPDERLSAEGDGAPTGSVRAMQQSMALLEPSTAVFCFDDMTAMGVIRTLARAGFCVPRDCSMVGLTI